MEKIFQTIALQLSRTNELIETQNQLLIEQQHAMDHMLHIFEQMKANIRKPLQAIVL